MNETKPAVQRLGVPYYTDSCHTAEIFGSFVEGHVPVVDIKRMLTEQPEGSTSGHCRLPQEDA